MTVRLTPRDHPERTLVIGGVIAPVRCAPSIVIGQRVELTLKTGLPCVFYDIAAIELDDAPGVWW